MAVISSICVVLALLAGTALWFLRARMRECAALSQQLSAGALELERLRTTIATLSESLQSARAECESLKKDVADLNHSLMAERQESAALSARIEMLADSGAEREKQAEARFRVMASEILRQNSEDLKARAEESIGQLISPLKTNIDEFRRLVSDSYSAEARERFSLAEKIRELVALNQSISSQAKQLSEALRGDSKVQGDWGEMVLESILEKSGLIKGEEYFTQVTTNSDGSPLRDAQGALLRPDVVVKYPDGRFVVIDSKVSLTAFVDYANADSEVVRRAAGERHVRSVRSHIDELARKRYQDYVGDAKLDFVMMFIPNEPAYIAAMRLEPALWQEAYGRHVLIVSPTHLVSGLKLISMLWSRDRHTRNAITIAEEAGKMLDKFADFTRDMERIDKGICSVRKAYDDAMTKLSAGTGNLVKRAENLRQLGVKASKQLNLKSE